jgi:putative ABC transport system permease protein
MRAKEVGVRKVLGSNRFQLIKQFLTESFLLNIIALILALVIDEISLPYFNNMTGRPLSIGLLQNNWLMLIAVFEAGVFLSGIYAAFVMSSFNPLIIFKTHSGKLPRKIDLHKALVIFQIVVDSFNNNRLPGS